MKKQASRVISGLLSVTMTASLCSFALPVTGRAETYTEGLPTVTQATGSIALTLAFDLPQRVEEVDSRAVQLTLRGVGRTMTVSLADGQTEGCEGLQVSVEKQNVQGVALTTEDQLGYCRVKLSGLPLGAYAMTVSGEGYVPCTVPVELKDYSQHVVMSTGDGTFSLGDVTGDGAVTTDDLIAMDGQLGLAEELEVYDLNGDGLVDIVDLSYVNKTMDVQGTPRVFSTAAIVAAAVDAGQLQVTGDLNNLFTGEEAVTVAPAESGGDLAIPIVLAEAVEMSEISITTPSANGAIQEGVALVETEEGETLSIPFQASAPQGVYALGRTAGQTVVTINLGAKVPVKKVTIQVTRVEGQAGEKPEFATVTQIEFLKDIVSDAIREDTQVKGLAATPGDGEVTLVWESLPNVTGYQVAYGRNQGSLDGSLTVSGNRAVISGLENNQTFYFQVTAVNGDWRGTPSAVLSAVPVPAAVPGAPSNIRVEAADGALRVSWGKTKDASFYQVFYRAQGEGDYLAWGGNLTATSAVITGLTNGTTYDVVIKAGNLRGVGPASDKAQGTPEKEGFDMPALPEDNRIDREEIISVVMKNPENVNGSLCPQFTVDHLVDGDPNTYWIAANWWDDSRITYTFRDTHDMNYLLVVPYLDAVYKNRIANYTVTLYGEDGSVLATYYRDGVNITGSDYYILTFPETKDVKSVTLALGEKTGGPRVSISEIAFYNSDTLADDIAALFADDAYTTLNSGVDASQIDALSQRLSALGSFYLDLARLKDELALAQSLLAGDASALGLVKDGFQSRSASAQADQAAGQSASALQPLGITANAGSVVAVYAQLPGDQPVYVVPTQFYGESGVWQGKAVELKNGRNYITVEKIGSLSAARGGMLYLTYAGDSPEEIRIQIRGGSGVYQMPVLELSGWYGMDEGCCPSPPTRCWPG